MIHSRRLYGFAVRLFNRKIKNFLLYDRKYKTAVSLDGERLLYIFLTVPGIAWMPLRGKSKTMPMLCRFEDAKKLKDMKQIMIVATAVRRKANCNSRFFMVR